MDSAAKLQALVLDMSHDQTTQDTNEAHSVAPNRTAAEYEPPLVKRLGTLKELTQGHGLGANDDGQRPNSS